MVSSSKKKRGKQRKAAKQQQNVASASNTPQTSLNPNQLALLYTPQGEAYVHPDHHKLAALYVERGVNGTTESMTTLTDEDVPCNGICWPNISLVQSGILSSVLNFLKRCEDETFDKVIAEAKGHVLTPSGDLIYNVGGDLVSPKVWIKVLMRAGELEPSCTLQIAENIGPLVRCMCNDMTRLFFQSNKHWREGIGEFVELVGRMLNTSEDEKVVDALLQNEGLLTSIVQWSYWKEEHRPDIVKELTKAGIKFEWIAKVGKLATTFIVSHAGILKDEKGKLTELAKDWLHTTGSAPIVSKAYDSSCSVSHVLSFIRRIKTDDGWDGDDFTNLQLLIDSDCVDKDVIMEVIDLGYTFIENTRRCNGDVFSTLLDLSSGILCTGTEVSDTHTAFAIRTGLIEMCLGFVKRSEHYPSTAVSIFDSMRHTFRHISVVSLHKKTAKAISHKRSSIEETLFSLEGDERISSNIKCKGLFDMVRSILDLSGSYCCRCNKQLSKTEVMECNGCGYMAYCSRACQKEDWLNGHSLTCCKSFTNETAGQFQGRYEPAVPDDERAASKLEDLEKNINMIQLKLFLDNAEDILNQAKELNLSLYDCVVYFDLCERPPLVNVTKYTEYLKPNEIEGFENSRSKDNITCTYVSVFNGHYDESENSFLLYDQRLFPHEWLTEKT